MEKGIIEFTLNGRKNTYLRRIDVYGKPVSTTNKTNAKKVKINETKKIIGLIIKEWGENNVKDIKFKKDE